MMTEAVKRFYYVDEAGDGNLFGKRGQVVLNQPGCSRYFIVGVLDVTNVEQISRELSELREQLLKDPYFNKVPSMQPEARKTYYAFHAKDDVPEVRREVFSVIRKHDFRFLAVVRNKVKLLDYVRQRNSQEISYHYHPNELYDYMVRVLFKNLLHKDQEYDITFSKRGHQDRTKSLKTALEQAQNRYVEQWHIINRSVLNVYPKTPLDCVPLQVADYFLWSLQRFFELNEDRYLELLWPSFRLVHDLDDTRKARYGCYYTQKKPLTLAALEDT